MVAVENRCRHLHHQCRIDIQREKMRIFLTTSGNGKSPSVASGHNSGVYYASPVCPFWAKDCTGNVRQAWHAKIRIRQERYGCRSTSSSSSSPTFLLVALRQCSVSYIQASRNILLVGINDSGGICKVQGANRETFSSTFKIDIAMRNVQKSARICLSNCNWKDIFSPTNEHVSRQCLS